jgi:5-methylcytosine-specific restriction endonuclease McrA
MPFKDKEKYKAYQAAWQAANREEQNARRLEWRKANLERDKARSRAWYTKNKENKEITKQRSRARYAEKVNEIKAQKATYREKNKEHIKEHASKWRKENKDKKNTYEHTRRARKAGNGGKLSKDIIIRLLFLQKRKCAICKKNMDKTGHHLDHIIPLHVGGANSDRNVQLTCPMCNAKKGRKDPIQFMQSIGYLL